MGDLRESSTTPDFLNISKHIPAVTSSKGKREGSLAQEIQKLLHLFVSYVWLRFCLAFSSEKKSAEPIPESSPSSRLTLPPYLAA